MESWLVKFQSNQIGQAFTKIFESARNNNASVASGTTSNATVEPSKQESNEPEQPATPQLANKTEQKQSDNNQQVKNEVNEQDDKYKGWSQEDIEQDKQRLAKSSDAEQAKLFESGDNSQQTTSWKINAFDSNNNSEILKVMDLILVSMKINVELIYKLRNN